MVHLFLEMALEPSTSRNRFLEMALDTVTSKSKLTIKIDF